MILRAENLGKRYFRKTARANNFFAVRSVDLELTPGTVTLLAGRSGSGKTTLLHMLAGLLAPTEGRVLLDETNLYAMDDAALSRLRNRNIGVVPQGRSAVDALTVLENVLLPGQMYGGVANREEALGWLEKLDIAALADARPAELSGGELRRMAIARAMLMRPGILLADEPTAGLDNENTLAVLGLLRKAADEGAGVLLVTHENEAAQFADEVYVMDGGKLSTQ